ncbi:MAG: Holliday junction branch migration protein RuvA, partial [Xanthomonadales bacterium]|nr:Holliday junction branch migration protein RuvA [Xanthomonadales bacterium]
VQKVSGIGAKSALAILSGSSAEDFARQIHAGDLAGLMRIPGIGKKTAERLILELRDKLGGLGASAQPATDSATNPIQASALDEAGIALQQLGYKPAEAARMAKLAAEPGDTAESIIRKALRAALRN